MTRERNLRAAIDKASLPWSGGPFIVRDATGTALYEGMEATDMQNAMMVEAVNALPSLLAVFDAARGMVEPYGDSDPDKLIALLDAFEKGTA